MLAQFASFANWHVCIICNMQEPNYAHICISVMQLNEGVTMKLDEYTQVSVAKQFMTTGSKLTREGI